MDELFWKLLSKFRRIAVVGGPQTGKTTITRSVDDRAVFHTDNWKGRPWADIPDLVIAAVSGTDTFVVEGVQVARVLRKGLKVDVVLVMETPKVDLTDGQRRMAKGVRTVMNEVIDTMPDLLVYREEVDRDVAIVAGEPFSVRAC